MRTHYLCAGRRLCVALFSAATLVILIGCGAGTGGQGGVIDPGPDPGPGGGGTYTGRHQDWVHLLLNRDRSIDGSWTISTDPNKAGTPPDITKLVDVNGGGCIRDSYVAAAVTNAWGAESYAAIGKTTKAVEQADAMYQNLQNADQLCSDSPVIGDPIPCKTENIFKCGELDSNP